MISDQLARFVNLNHFQLAGHAANLDFWIAQTKHALDVIDGYGQRFHKLKSGQSNYISRHQTYIPSPFDSDIQPPPPPRKVPSDQLQTSRRAIVDAAYSFLRRLYHQNMITKSVFQTHCQTLGTSIDIADLKRPP